jgi:hypothetical protein
MLQKNGVMRKILYEDFEKLAGMYLHFVGEQC